MLLKDFIIMLQALPPEAQEMPVKLAHWNAEYQPPSEEEAECVDFGTEGSGGKCVLIGRE